MPWKMILVRSNGATAVLATAPAKAPEKSELRTERVCFRPCRDGGITIRVTYSNRVNREKTARLLIIKQELCEGKLGDRSHLKKHI